MRPDDLSQLKEDLLQYRSEFEDADARAQLLEVGLPRCLATLEMIPEEMRAGDFLELGASPFLLTLCLRQVCRGRFMLANYYGTDEQRGSQRLVNQRTGHALVFDYDLFNVEVDEFPYADASFDVVIFSELIEHLALNPVWALGEIHRILRPGGYVIVTTPNSLSLERLATYLGGGSQMVDKYSPPHGYGARHNREYHPRELRQLLQGTGFVIEEMVIRDLASHSAWTKLKRACAKRVLRLISDHPRDEHIFLRARRGERFRWYFPADLFDQMHLYHLVRHPYVDMGANDRIQCTDGWAPLEDWAEMGGEIRRVTEQAKALLKAPEAAGFAGIELFATRDAGATHLSARFIVRDRWVGTNPAYEGVYLDVGCKVEKGSWQSFEFPHHPSVRPSSAEEVEVVIETASGTAVRRIWLSSEGGARTGELRPAFDPSQ